MLGLSFGKFIFSIINFICLLFLLKKLLFKPVMNILEERKARVAAELAKADDARLEVSKLKEVGESIVFKAREEGDVILKKAQQNAEELIAQARLEASRMVQDTRASIEREKDEIRREIYSTLIDLVSYASKKVMYGSIGEDYQKELIESSVLQSLKQSAMRGGMAN